MFSYKKNLVDALELRHRQTTPKIGGPVLLLAVGLFAYIWLTGLITPEGDPTEHFSEEGLVTALSTVFMAMTCSFAGLCYLLNRRREGLGKYFWLMVSIGFLFFAIDEQYGYHEWWGNLLWDSEIGPPDSFRNWNDVIVISYGIIGLAGIIAFLPEVLRFPMVAEVLGTGFAFFALHTFIDSTETSEEATMAVEESAKLFATAFFAMSMLVAVIAAIAQKTRPGRNEDGTGV